MPIPSDLTDFTSGNPRRFRFRGLKSRGLVPMPDYIEVKLNSDSTNLLAKIGKHSNVPVLRLLDPADGEIKLYPAENFEEVTAQSQGESPGPQWSGALSCAFAAAPPSYSGRAGAQSLGRARVDAK